MKARHHFIRLFAALILAAVCVIAVSAQNVKRVVVIKVDGLPGYFVDKYVKQRDLATGRSVLPWFDEIFYKNGARLENFYTRGMSLSASSWGQLDTGQHIQIKGNIEFDRYTKHGYDYLYIVPYYVNYLFRKKADMAAVEVLDQLKIPLLCDAFTYERRYTSQQLYQRGNNWENMASGFVNIFPRKPKEFLDEWTIGGDFLNFTINQAERDIIEKVVKNPEIDYFDYYTGYFDHISHANNDAASRLAAIKSLDRTLGRISTAIQASSRADETAMILVSDHGFNTDAKIYSQGFNIVKLLGSTAGGGHHVVIKQKMMLDYSIKPLYPMFPTTTNPATESFYLPGQKDKYPTALVDLDGNERASLHLRERELNILQILLQQLQTQDLSPEMQRAVTDAFFDVVEERRGEWKKTVAGLNKELDALLRSKESQDKIVSSQPTKFTLDEVALGIDKQARRVMALRDIDANAEKDYRKYLATLSNLIGLTRERFDPKAVKIENLVAPGSMGDSNSIYQLQNYVVGLSWRGLTLNADKGLDVEKSFTHINYFDLFTKQMVKNNVQPELSNRPIDFVAVRISQESISGALPADMRSNEDAIWLNSGGDKQALILSRVDADGGESYRYIPIASLTQDKDRKTTFQIKEWADGFPLKLFEEKNLDVPTSDRAAWLSQWHTDLAWLRATHKALYSNAIIGLNEQIDRHPVFTGNEDGLATDERLIRRFRQRQRNLTEADMLLLANNHWNFDVQGFNPGGNHGSFFRVSTNSSFMVSGGSKTGLPHGLVIDEPYDGMSFMPTVLAMMGKIDSQNQLDADLTKRGFQKFPGRVVQEFLTAPTIK